MRPGDAGRFLIADNGNVVPSFGTTIGATTADFAGTGGGGVNPFIQGGATSTFNVVDLTGGADVYGLKSGVNIDSSYFDSVRTGAPVGAVAALVRRAAGPAAGEGYFAHDLLMLVNLTPSPLANPQLGVGAPGSGFSTPLLQQGFVRNPLFGGVGPVTLSSLPAGAVYATLVPNGSTLEVSARAGDATLTGLSLATLGTLGVAYLSPSSGDFNFDGRVTGADFLLWQRGGSPNPRSAPDLAQWKSNYGAGAATATTIAVPEPQAWLLCGLTLLGLRQARRR